MPPLDFTAASWAQHALTPAGAAPPQQLSGCVFRDSSEVVVVWLVLMALSSLCELAARVHLYGRRRVLMDARGRVVNARQGRASFPAVARPYRQERGRRGGPMQTTADSEKVRAAVRETYGRIATEQPSGACCGTSGCCGPSAQPTSEALGAIKP